MRYISKSEDDTRRIAEKLAPLVDVGYRFFALFGGMGVGKTAFVRHFVREIGYGGSVCSPTFAIVNNYHCYDYEIFHFDMYRVESADDLYSTGYFEYLDAKALIICEWSENIEYALPDDCVRIYISAGESENERIFDVRLRNYDCSGD